MMAFPILTGLIICMCGEVIGVLEIFTMGLIQNFRTLSYRMLGQIF